MIKIKIRLIGSNRKNGLKLKHILMKVIKTKDYNIDVEEINNKYGMKNACLIIDDKVIVQADKLNEKKINLILNKCV